MTTAALVAMARSSPARLAAPWVAGRMRTASTSRTMPRRTSMRAASRNIGGSSSYGYGFGRDLLGPPARGGVTGGDFDGRGRRLAAALVGPGAAVGEDAAGAGRGRLGPGVGVHGRPPAGGGRVGHGDGLQQEVGVGMAGLTYHLLGGSGLDDDPVEHDDYPPALGEVAHHAEVVADEEVG